MLMGRADGAAADYLALGMEAAMRTATTMGEYLLDYNMF